MHYGLDCDLCSGQLKESRGCGVAPWSLRFDDNGQSSGLHPFTPRYLWERAEWAGPATPVDMLAEELWELADLGDAISCTGSPWRCCPAWYARFSSHGARKAAADAFELERWRDSGALSSRRSSPLQPWQVTLIDVASRALNAYRMRDFDRRNPRSPKQEDG